MDIEILFVFLRVKSKRRFVGPNPGFISQLQLYETMKWQVDRSNIQFRMYRLQIAADQVKKGNILLSNILKT